jgi:precorrin-2 dehydrogenase/sirohydrochlorin ferrochelatase
VSQPVGHPVFLDLAGEPVVVVGAGAVAERKIAALLESGARVTVIAPKATPRLLALAEGGEVRLLARPYGPGDLAGCRLAYVATDDPEVSRAVRAEATALGVWLNVADQPELCGFIAPAVVRRGDLTLAVSTGGASPALARWIRERLEADFGPEYGRRHPPARAPGRTAGTSRERARDLQNLGPTSCRRWPPATAAR